MKNRNNIIILCRCLATVLLLACVLGWLSGVFKRKESWDRYQEFYEQSENVDVLVLGTSHAFNAISPMDMWEQNGIVAYDLAAPGCRIATAYWILKNALQYTSPRLVVMDCAYLLDVKAHENAGYVHTAFDAMPLSKTKLEALWDLHEQKEDILQHLFPFSLYHSRWSELEKRDFSYKPVYGKMGFSTGCDVVNATLPDFTVSEIKAVDNVSVEYLYKMINLCEAEGMDLLLTFLPFDANKETRNEAAFVRTIAEEKGITFLGPDELLQCVDTGTDFLNNDPNNSHLNLSGAHKMSYYLGNYIAQNYAVPDQRNNPRYDAWYGYYTLYEDYKLSLLKEQEQLENYMVAMADQNYSCAVYLHDRTCLQDEQVQKLLKNLDMDVDASVDAELLLLQTKDSWMKDAQIRIDEDGNPALYLGNEVLYGWSVPVTSAGVYAVVMDNTGETVLDAAAFAAGSKGKVS